MSTPENYTAKLLQDLPFFDGMEAAERDIILASSTIKLHPKRTVLFFQGDTTNTDNTFFIIIKGWVKLCNVTSEGEEFVVTLLTRDAVFSKGTIFNDTAHHFSAEVVVEAQVIEIPAALLRERLKGNSDIATRVIGTMADEIEKLQMTNSRLTAMNAPERLSCFLLRTSSWMTGGGGSFTLPYDKSTVAAQLGINPATFSRVLAKLESKGVTTRGSEINIQDFKKLSEFCCTHCPIPEDKCACKRMLLRCKDEKNNAIKKVA